jgi:ABC-type multidrug transport system ATPase subunit
MGLVITSHTAQEIGPPFERVVMLTAGSVVFDGTPQAFLAGGHPDALVAKFAAAVSHGR